MTARLILLGRYSVRVQGDGERELLCDGGEWMQAQPDTVVWELIDKVLELESRESDGQ